MARLPNLSALLLALLLASCGLVGANVWDNSYPSIQPPHSLMTLQQKSPQAVYDNTTLLGSLGASISGIKTAIQQDLFSLAEGVPAELLYEPGIDLLGAAVMAYQMLYPGVDTATRTKALIVGKEEYSQYFEDFPSFANAGSPNLWWHVVDTSMPKDVQTELDDPTASIGNGATMYSQNWYDLDAQGGPLVLAVPPMEAPGYWLIIFVDWYQEVYHSIGTRTGAEAGGKWLLVPEGWHGEVPAGIPPENVITSPTPQGLMFGRTQQNSPNAVNWTLAWEITGLDGEAPTSPPTFGYTYNDSTLALPVQNVSDPFYFWEAAGEVLAENPKPGLENTLAWALPALGLSKSGFNPENISDLAEQALMAAPAIAARLMEARYLFLGTNETNYWHLPVMNERWGDDYSLGAAIIKGFWTLNWLEDAAYYFGYLDSTGMPLNGSNTYRLTFDTAPPRNGGAFWGLEALDLTQLAYATDNIVLYSQGYLASSAVTSIQPTTNVTADGSFVMVVSPDQPADLAEPGVNWVRHSFEGHPIFLVMRVYWPDERILENEYVLPLIEPETKDA